VTWSMTVLWVIYTRRVYQFVVAVATCEKLTVVHRWVPSNSASKQNQGELLLPNLGSNLGLREVGVLRSYREAILRKCHRNLWGFECLAFYARVPDCDVPINFLPGFLQSVTLVSIQFLDSVLNLLLVFQDRRKHFLQGSLPLLNTKRLMINEDVKVVYLYYLSIMPMTLGLSFFCIPFIFSSSSRARSFSLFVSCFVKSYTDPAFPKLLL